ncbi:MULTISPECIES: SCP2 sterol-binding domain-containing protein [unclassified Butyrivibrio]|uniref:SCP2 sterol-binding domain-containing protein n=1 Tax=unclassified Butyrivibrio TaxID=2639466 RepID=UPI0003B34D60|nr:MULTISPECIES: SCP2 sterol-binding domain-containing protein [unclassified Butyrivibrio]MDC7292183.1 SCP2 sterol-binding domain-containing protein [Butyrivibrio sp. DSM 10294]
MKINIYYGGRGIIDDPTLQVISQITTVLQELNVKVQQYNLYEQRNGITALPGTLKDADGIILASTVEWFGVGGYMMQFLDSCWLYGDKNRIREIYMAPVVMSTTHGEREGMMSLTAAWEMLGGLTCDGICGYIADTTKLETSNEYIKIIEKKTENIYRTINQKMAVFPTSNQVVINKVAVAKGIDLTPQESEQLSEYASDDKYVKKQKEDLQELASIFRDKMGQEDASTGSIDEYIKKLDRTFTPVSGIRSRYKVLFQDNPKLGPLIIDVDNAKCDCRQGDDDVCDVIITTDQKVFEDILEGRLTFQRAFMAGNIKMKGDFKLLRSMDQLFDLMQTD